MKAKLLASIALLSLPILASANIWNDFREVESIDVLKDISISPDTTFTSIEGTNCILNHENYTSHATVKSGVNLKFLKLAKNRSKYPVVLQTENYKGIHAVSCKPKEFLCAGLHIASQGINERCYSDGIWNASFDDIVKNLGAAVKLNLIEKVESEPKHLIID